MSCFFPDQNKLPDPNLKLRLAELNASLDKGNPEDFCFIRACEIFFEKAALGASKLLPDQIKRINTSCTARQRPRPGSPIPPSYSRRGAPSS